MTSDVPFREIPYLPQKLEVERRSDGSVLLRNGQPKRPHPPHMLAPLVYWASARPDQVFLAQRDPDDPAKPGWVNVTYGEALERVRALAQGFLDAGAGPDKPVMILSRNAIENALVMYAAMWAGSPVVPVTPAYATLSEDFARLIHIDRLTEPAIVYVEDGVQFQRGLKGMGIGERLVIYRKSAPDVANTVWLRDFAKTPTSEVDLAYDRLSEESVAKYMLTSGSTGEPKAVINTHGNVASMVKMIRSVWDVERLEEMSGGRPQVMVSFLPWSHTYGAHSILHSMLDWGGTLYIDWGAPTPARLPEMLRNLKEVATTQHTTVPAAWAAIATELEQDRALAETFFSRIMVMAYGGASMGQDIYERIQKVAVDVTGERISLSAGYGATETSPTISNVHWPSDTMGLLGLPLPGTEMKMVPAGEKMELRVRGPGITQGYLKNPEKTADAFDEEGFYKLGDAVKFKNPDNPDEGLAFDGRLAEEFKLANGTWVSAGTVRVKVVEAVDGPLSDVVVCGLNKDHIALLGFLNEGWCMRKTGRNVGLQDLATDETVRSAVREGLARYNKANPNAAKRVARILLQKDQPKADAGEITEKGYINQGRVQALRQDQLDRLYAKSPDEEIIELD
ncbi:feruloyl-CoA synthase [Henriciella sp.]|jgi:feruloyl-CoA synthase|uniref:feruloyl-CoA synthase n=1 Tax=Henriciella sp. TaxID=1968823 RepID=UPI000C0C9DC6|nr:feruloyl-CoA synthase [Henriciella sp.]PHR79521.1 MAG: feruloyl-CoA synthase [Henriciella sp.]